MDLKDRKLINSKEEKISIIQFIGFLLIISGIGIIICTVNHSNDPSVIAVAFFITMLGFAFAFPSMLEGNDGISTMRIVVFMMVNVICLLLIKIGWSQPSLEKIGLDQWWMGVIAFVFGAKATQSYFESKLAVPKAEVPKIGMAALEYSNAEIAKLAVAQNEQYLKVKFPNILAVSDAVHDLKHIESHVITLYLKDNNTVGIPDKLEVKMPNGSVKIIGTENVKNVGEGEVQYCQEDKIQTVANKWYGSMCCMIETSNNEKAIVTSGHIYSNDTSINYGGWLGDDQIKPVILNNKDIIGKWMFQLIDNVRDLALIKLDDNFINNDMIKFANCGFYDISDASVKNEKVTLIANNSKTKYGYILDYNTVWPVKYNDQLQYKSNILIVGSTNNRDNSITLSQKGDSGGVVFHTNSGKIIGIILGGNAKYTWVLPLKETFEYFELKLL